MKSVRKIQIMLSFVLIGLWVPAGCGASVPEPIFTGIQNSQPDSKEDKDTLRQDGEYTLVFNPDDLAPEEIICGNVFLTYQDGRENPEILGLYEKVREQWEYLYYVEYDLDEDGGEPEYIVLHCNPEEGPGKESNICGGDIWYRGNTNYQDSAWLRQKLPETSYLVGGTWEDPALYMMLLTHAHNDMMLRDIAVYQDYEALELAIYGRDGPAYNRVKARSIVEEAGEVRIRLTSYQTLDGSLMDFFETPVRLELIKEENGQHFYQVLLADRISLELTEGGTNCTAWDGNNDGYEDILYYAGNAGGSGGWWSYYYLLCWSEEEQKYIKMELPACTSIDYEKHRIYSQAHHITFERYEIYGLRDGEYQLEKELEIEFAMQEEAGIATYSECGETVEQMEISDMAPEEREALFGERYPDFLVFWQ